ncbi:uncharacterized protein PHALS_14076 [Plasmopara halstedii]|uniref:Retrovirus-related Pol polyprotein from transposon TNT 1-94-like beta-barrel domain-containing protein n=1 Tax=Plasmopara halstedii TaxID=4781 RepID=A0A0P1AQE9_PLAHL|nr:uncharacterized protein PHALS_14076 [Plasmopara halstedii]CEG43784.1 hypothetical protein PHALS_14076 [Plasmopara halstedii]|eukprot:XP_024580153.1 hypothetical protein PHALS_14076 [Plasmopara halstedii]
MFRIKSELKSYGYDVKDINMRQMMLDSLPGLYEYEQLRGAVNHSVTREIVLLIQVVINGSSREAAQVLAISIKMGNKGARIIGTVMTDCTAIIDGVAEPGAASTSGGNTGTNVGTQRRQQRSNYTSRDGELRADRRGVAEDDLGVAAGIAMVNPMLAVPDMKSENDKMAKSLPEGLSWWCFDTGSNVHLTGDRSLFVHLEEIRQKYWCKCRLCGRHDANPCVGDTEAEVFLDDVLYVESASHGLFSMHLAITKQKFEISYDQAASTFSQNGEQVIFAVPREGIWVFEAKRPADAPRRPGLPRVIVNYTIADGVATLEQWHNRTRHKNAQYLMIMADRGLAAQDV